MSHPDPVRYVPCPRCGHQWDGHGEQEDPGDGCPCCAERLPALRWISDMEQAVVAEAEHIAGGPKPDPPYIIGKDVFLGERVVYRQFTCASCGALCTTTTTEAEANREYLNSGMEGEMSSVCDDCYERITAAAKADGLL